MTNLDKALEIATNVTETLTHIEYTINLVTHITKEEIEEKGITLTEDEMDTVEYETMNKVLDTIYNDKGELKK